MNTPEKFVAALAGTKLPSVFNPYRDTCSVHDRPNAAELRCQNLIRCLTALVEDNVDTIWIARDLGYRGGRRTGIALTDEVHLAPAQAMMGGVQLVKATQGPVVAERTAAVVWRALSQIGKPVMLWNVFPFHPHDDGDPMTNRCHTRSERIATWPILLGLVGLIRPKQIVAIGKDAAQALAEIDVPITTVRHPSYGGQSEFLAGIQSLYGVSMRSTVEYELFSARP